MRWMLMWIKEKKKEIESEFMHSNQRHPIRSFADHFHSDFLLTACEGGWVT